MNHTVPLLFAIILLATSCSKKDIPSGSTSTISNDKISFSIQSFDTINTNIITSDSIAVIINLLSKVPPNGVTYSIKVFDSSSTIIYSKDSISKNSTITLNGKGYQIGKKFTTNITVTSNNSSSNTSSQKILVQRNRVYKNYQNSSYELAKYDLWFSRDSIYSNGIPYKNIWGFASNPLEVMQSAQLDIDGDGREDLFYYESYDVNQNSIPNLPPVIFMNNGSVLNKTTWSGPIPRDSHGAKVLIGDFNKDSLPDIFSLVAFDPPITSPPNFSQNSHLFFNSINGFNKVIEFKDNGYWYSGCSGDIDNDGDLDVIMINFSFLNNGIQSKIQWNDGLGNFKSDSTGIGKLAVVDQAELIDINHDGFLDLIISRIIPNYTPCPCPRNCEIDIMWGNGKGFSSINKTIFTYASNFFLNNIHSLDLNGDNFDEIILSGYDGNNTLFWVETFQSNDKGKSWLNNTNSYFDNNKTTSRFDHTRLQDIDKNGKIDLFAPDKKDNIRWEWNGTKFVKK